MRALLSWTLTAAAILCMWILIVATVARFNH